MNLTFISNVVLMLTTLAAIYLTNNPLCLLLLTMLQELPYGLAQQKLLIDANQEGEDDEEDDAVGSIGFTASLKK